MTMKFILLAIAALAALEVLVGAIFLFVAWIVVSRERQKSLKEWPPFTQKHDAPKMGKKEP